MPTDALAPAARRIGQLIRMLASDKDGEVVAAAKALQRTLASAGADFHELAASLERAAPSIGTAPPGDVVAWREMTDWLSRNSARLSIKEREFIRSMSAWRGKPTERQATWLEALFSREHGRQP